MEVVFHKKESIGETMSDMKNSAGKYSENTIHKLMDVAHTIAVNADDLKETVETIIASCHMQGTKGETQKSMLLEMVDGMKVLAGLYRSVAKKYEHAAIKLEDGIPEDKILHELRSYNVCISDQIKSEKACYEQVLNMIKA